MNNPENPDPTSPAGEELDPMQERAIAALLTHPTIKKAAESIDIGERTLHRWLDDPTFSAAYRKARRLSFAQAISVAQHYAPGAVHTLAKVMSDPASAPASRVAAAMGLLKFSRESIELDDLAQRVEALERSQRGDPEPEPIPAVWHDAPDTGPAPDGTKEDPE